MSHENAQPARPSGARGRRPKPIVGYEPAAQLARQLRELISAAGLIQREVAKRAGRPPSVISGALNGQKLPNWDLLRRIIDACGVTDPGERRNWERRLRAAEEATRAFRPDLDGVTTVAELVARLATLLTEQLDPPLDPDILSQRLAANDGQQIGRLRVVPLPADEIAAVLDHRRPLPGGHLDNLLFAAGGSAKDIAHWSRHLRRLAGDAQVIGGSPPVLAQPDPGASATSGPATTSGPAAADPAGRSATGSPPIITALQTGEVLRLGEPGRVARRRTPAGVAVVVLAALLVGAGVAGRLTWWSDDGRGADGERPAGSAPTRTDPARTDPARTDPSMVPGPADPGLGIAAAEKLTGVAGRVVARSEPPQLGRFTYIHVRTWSRDTTRIGTGTETPETRQDDQFWWAADGSGRRVYTVDRADGPQRRVVTLDRGEWLPDPAPAPDPSAFRNQLAGRLRPDAEPAEWLRQAIGPYHDHVLNPAQRAAVLRLIAGLPGLAYQGMRLDRMGRAGIAVSIDTPGRPGQPGAQDTVIFDAETGAALSHERVLLPGQPVAVDIDTEAGPGPAPDGPDSYVLFVEQSRTDRDR
ncbi:helix-turn-helix domain-containing protein [Solwaraspora sp. WMMD1047]|uniref:helix-turn-helix domain-containing protein n=1 Tax=Solwaraspora sp. WMMD1047 TaxID=3016102 RepID=UPI0024171193|nr:helix-turn-helix domain-containing protein [Solwaraspora sp. WMMD1047]MDG4832894.1 helix-turn-helix domain-containing protein [Solwaraspora sp. WMMD1047]